MKWTQALSILSVYNDRKLCYTIVSTTEGEIAMELKDRLKGLRRDPQKFDTFGGSNFLWVKQEKKAEGMMPK